MIWVIKAKEWCKLKFEKKLLQCLLILLLAAGCAPEAPHNNPLDPYRNSNAGEAKLAVEGDVLQKQAPYFPIKGCRVFLAPESIVDTTDANGHFAFQYSQNGAHWLYFEHPDFQRDTLYFNSDSLSSGSLQIHLNGLPIFKDARVTSFFVDQWWPGPVTLFEVRAEPTDPDGNNDIISWAIRIPDFGFQEEILWNSQDESINYAFQADSLLNSPEEIVGHPVYLQLIDTDSATTQTGPLYVYRVMNTSPDSLVPTGLELAPNPPVFRWGRFPAGFSYHYNLAVYVVNAGISTLIHQKKAIPSDSAQYTYPEGLPGGQYFWTLTVEDDFGNRARSKEAAFIIQN